MHDLHVFSLLMSKLEEMRDVWESRFNGLERLHKRKRTEKSPLKATFSFSSKHIRRRYLAWEMSLLFFFCFYGL